jgi:hypothetical protein
MRKSLSLTVFLLMLLSIPAFAFVCDFETAEVEIVHRWSDVDFSFLDGWFGRVGPSDYRAIEVLSAYGAETSLGAAYEGDYMMGVVFYDTATSEPIGATKWDFNARPGEGGFDKYSSVVAGDTITFHVWIPPKGEIDTQLLYQPYSQYLDWGVFDDDSIGIDSLYDVEGFTDGGWKAFDVILPDTVSGADILSTGIQFQYPDTVNPGDTIYVDLIHSTDYSGIDIPAEDASVVISLPNASVNKLSYEINAGAFIHIAVYNTLGQRVKQIVPGLQSPGNYSVDLDLAPGVYLYKVTANKTGKTAKLIIL